MIKVTLILRRFDETIGIDADTSLSCVSLYNLRDVFSNTTSLVCLTSFRIWRFV